jgi:hypothetical protein
LEGKRLGNKLLFESTIHEITGIANKALRSDALSNFSIKERRSWAERRNTTIEEDEAYCLIGIFDVSMVPNYGERRDQAFRRLEEEILKLYKGKIEIERRKPSSPTVGKAMSRPRPNKSRNKSISLNTGNGFLSQQTSSSAKLRWFTRQLNLSAG